MSVTHIRDQEVFLVEVDATTGEDIIEWLARFGAPDYWTVIELHDDSLVRMAIGFPIKPLAVLFKTAWCDP